MRRATLVIVLAAGGALATAWLARAKLPTHDRSSAAAATRSIEIPAPPPLPPRGSDAWNFDARVVNASRTCPFSRESVDVGLVDVWRDPVLFFSEVDAAMEREEVLLPASKGRRLLRMEIGDMCAGPLERVVWLRETNGFTQWTLELAIDANRREVRARGWSGTDNGVPCEFAWRRLSGSARISSWDLDHESVYVELSFETNLVSPHRWTGRFALP